MPAARRPTSARGAAARVEGGQSIARPTREDAAGGGEAAEWRADDAPRGGDGRWPVFGDADVFPDRPEREGPRARCAGVPRAPATGPA